MSAWSVPRGAKFEQDLLEEWNAALRHAGLAEDRVRLWFGREPHDEQVAARYFVPIQDLAGEHGLSDDQLAEAQSDGVAGLHRVVIYPDYDFDGKADDVAKETVVPLFGGFLRHELQHALQQEAVGTDVLRIDDALIDYILVEKYDRLPGSAAAYNAKPIEQDGNAAASMYLRERHPDLVETIISGPISHLAKSVTPPEDPSTLRERMVCFLFTYHDVCERWAGQTPFAHYLKTYDDQAAELWKSLTAGTS